MLGSWKSPNQCQDHCFSQGVYALHLSYTKSITQLICTTVPSAGTTQTKHFFLWTLFTDRPFHTNHIKKGKRFKWKLCVSFPYL